MVDHAQRQPVLEIREIAGGRIEAVAFLVAIGELAVKGDGHVFVPADAVHLNERPPSPRPSPQGEGESSAAERQIVNHRSSSRTPIVVPSPGGEGQDEGGSTKPAYFHQHID